jgi:hypothetical protein
MRLLFVLLAAIASADSSKTTAKRAGLDWWSLQPIAQLQPPPATPWARNAIDHFVHAKLVANNLAPSSEASKRTLVRRLSYDLIGLPPTPQEVEAFVADKSADAYERLVEQLLASPHYGERWARHWLDVVHFGESNGFEYNQPRNNAWPYRNWVINALNADMPYDEFVRQQIAGDILAPDTGGAVAVGCLVTGPHNTTKPQNDTMRKTMRQDEMEDMIGMVNQTFLAMTTNCARCHDHKFDPISIEDYYGMAASLAGVEFGERTAPASPKAAQDKARVAALSDELAELERLAREAVQTDGTAAPGPAPFAAWNFDESLEDRIGDLDVTLVGGAKRDASGLVVDGKAAFARSKPLSKALAEKTLEAWVRLPDLKQRGGGVISLQSTNGVTFDGIVYGEKEAQRWMAGSNSFRRYKAFGGSKETEAGALVHVSISYAADGGITGYRNGAPYGKAYKTGFQQYAAGSTELVFGLRHGAVGGNRMLTGTIVRARLYDRALTAADVMASAAASGVVVSEADLLAQLGPAQRQRRATLKQEIQVAQAALAAAKPAKVWTVTPIRPATVKVLARGDVRKAGEVVAPRGLPAIQTIESDFGLKPDAPDKERRAKLAHWITNPKNPLFARVIVNRVWHYHFGAGIVATPNDFGFSGSKPTHPELLDWLAADLQANGWSLKQLHRLIVSSATYRQASAMNAEAAAIDAGNRFLWRKSPARLEGEALRDSMLRIAGKLDPTIGGKGYRDMREYKFKGSHFYDPIPQTKPEQFRRTIYRFSPRGAKRTMLDTFDCPDPSALTPTRAETTTPLQSLALMNNAFVLQMANALAERLQATEPDVEAQVRELFRLAYGREGASTDLARATPFIETHGLPAYCRVVFNSNELLYVR